MKAHVEYTDTFGGEANYSWVKRCEFDADGMSDLAVMRKAKREMGLSWVRGKTYRYGDMLEFRPYGMCRVMFITFM